MINLRSRLSGDAANKIEALDTSLAMIEFDPSGVILAANANFCKALGYEEREIVGQRHSLFVEPEYAASQAYRDFWAKLARGEFDAREYLRLGKGGREAWIQASYNPVKNAAGRVTKILKVATDITHDDRRALADNRHQRHAGRVARSSGHALLLPLRHGPTAHVCRPRGWPSEV